MPACVVALYLERLIPLEETPFTVTSQLAVTFPVESEAVMIAVPVVSPLTTPFFTEATTAFEVDHLTLDLSESFAVRLTLEPCSIEADDCEILIVGAAFC